MCSSGGQVGATDQALQASQAAMTNQLNSDYSTTFGEQQAVLSSLQSKMNYMATNPMGYASGALAAMRTGVNESTATAAKQAIGAAGAYAGTHGGADVGNGAAGQIAGEIGSQAELSKSAQLTGINEQNEQLKQENYWKAIQGLSSVGSEYGGSGGTAIGGAGNAASTSTGAGSGALAAQEAGWQNLSGVLTGIGGLATGVGSIPGVKV